jgi:hypothetical protein
VCHLIPKERDYERQSNKKWSCDSPSISVWNPIQMIHSQFGLIFWRHWFYLISECCSRIVDWVCLESQMRKRCSSSNPTLQYKQSQFIHFLWEGYFLYWSSWCLCLSNWFIHTQHTSLHQALISTPFWPLPFPSQLPQSLNWSTWLWICGDRRWDWLGSDMRVRGICQCRWNKFES